MKDLRKYTDYRNAIAEGIWAYFFMRGLEGHMAGYSEPVYQKNARALYYYREGRRHADRYNFGRGIGLEDLHDFCSAFLQGSPEAFGHWPNRGYLSRMVFENTYANTYPKPPSYLPAIEPEFDKEETTTMNELYKIVNEDVYGHIVGKDSRGRVLLEVKGTSAIRACNKDEIEEVTPYTILLKSIHGTAVFISNINDYNVGDVVLIKTSGGPVLHEVVAINTKNKKATVEAKDFILATIYKGKSTDNVIADRLIETEDED